MKIYCLILFSLNVFAVVPGDLDISFANNGLILNNNNNQISLNKAIAIDDFANIYVAGISKTLSPISDYFITIARYKDTGQLDGLFSTSDTVFIDSSLIHQDFGMAIDENDGIFLAFSIMTCASPNTSCQQDIMVRHYSISGILLDFKVIAFDLGNTYLRQNDVFAGLTYIATLKKLAIVATVDRNGVFDTDFGVAMLDVGITGDLSLSTNFSGDGLQLCLFDQADAAGSYDTATSIIQRVVAPYNIIVGGSAFEGNGVNNDGWNLAFCEFDVLGVEQNKWSTQPMPDTLYDKEILQDMVLSTANSTNLVVTLQLPDLNGGMDFSVVDYHYNSVTDEWDFFANYGDNSNGWQVIGFNQLFIGDTEDIPKQIIVQENGSVFIAGNSSWQDNGINHSQISMAKLDFFGRLDTSWGHSGKITHNFSGTNNDIASGMVQNKISKELYLTGSINPTSNMTGFVANLRNSTDEIFNNSFE